MGTGRGSDARFDLNGDENINPEDLLVWVKDLMMTWYGDANLDGEFNSSDFVQVFETGKYEKGWLDDDWGSPQGELAHWSDGDWNGDGVFDSLDFVLAFQDGGYEQGPRTDVVAVPEPGTMALLGTAACLLLLRCCTGRRSLLLMLPLLLLPTATVHADIYHRHTGEVIPGTEGIEPEPGVQLDHHELAFALLRREDLTDSRFDFFEAH